MPTEILNYTIPASGSNPAVTVNATLTIDANGLATDITGTWNGVQITGLITAANGGGFDGNDNLVTVGANPFVDGYGISFTLAGGTGGDDGNGNVNFYSVGPNSYAEAFTSATNATTSSATLTPACYVRGTMILTDAGERAVETLAIGDIVVTASGARVAIRWIGQRSYAGRFLHAQPHLLPVLFRAHAIADGVPSRDLQVSPAHCMFLDGVLVPARDLINGTTVVQVSNVDSVDYFHVELPAHAVLVANGAASESFVDDDSRGMFHNVTQYAALYPDAVQTAAAFCAPRVTSGYQLDAIRATMASRATEVRKAA